MIESANNSVELPGYGVSDMRSGNSIIKRISAAFQLRIGMDHFFAEGGHERMRAKRSYFTRDRDRFIVGRGVLRFILGRYLYVEPNRVKHVLSLSNQRMIFNVL